MANVKKTNWQRIRDKRYLETAQGRDVYNEQQMERGALREKQTMTGRLIICVIAAVIVFFLTYGLWCIVASLGSGVRSYADSTGTAGSYGTSNGTYGSGTDSFGSSVDEMPERQEGGGTGYVSGTSGDNWQWHSSAFREAYGERDVSDEGSEGYTYSYGDTDNETSHETGETEAETGGDTSSAAGPGSLYGMASGQAKEADVSQNEAQGGGLKIDWSVRGFNHLFFSFMAAFVVFALLYQVMKKNLAAQNSLSDMTDINQYTNDQHIALPEEIQQKYDWFPDAGATSSVQVSSMISHMMVMNKGIKTVQFSRRYDKDIVDEDGTVVHYKGEVIRDDEDNAVTDTVPMFDEKFATDLFRASFKKKEDADAVFMAYDARKIPYNPNNNDRDKLKGFDLVSDLINNDWEIPEYETQRPAGAYIVDTAPVNTMVKHMFGFA